jgi:hypothetical protein
MKNVVKIAAVLVAVAVLGGCFLFGEPGLSTSDVHKSLAIAGHEAANSRVDTVPLDQVLVVAPAPIPTSFVAEIPGPTSGNATWEYTIEGIDPTGSITFDDFKITTDTGDEHVINGSATLTIAGSFPTFTAAYAGTLSISVNGESGIEAEVDATYTFTVTVSNPVTLEVTASGTVNGAATEESFTVTFSAS